MADKYLKESRNYKEEFNDLLKLYEEEELLSINIEEKIYKYKLEKLNSLHELRLSQLLVAEQREIDSQNRREQARIQAGVSNGQITMKETEKIQAQARAKELKEKLKNSKSLTDAEKKDLEQKYKAEEAKAKKLATTIAGLKKIQAKVDQQTIDDQAKETQENFKKLKKLHGDTATVKEAMKAQGYSDDEIARAEKRDSIEALDKAGKAIADFAKKLQDTVKDIAYAQGAIDTRLQGSNNDKAWLTGSYWKQMNDKINAYVAASPLVKQSDVVNNLKTLVGKGIAFNVEQRAFLDTVSSKIATTFEATEGTLLKLIRIQQADTTAARLGMESALTAFLNNMYETTEYMSEMADSIRGSIYEASALMGAAEATAFEYQVQKWMGSLHSVGFSNTGGISGALGKLAAGDISGITEGGYGNLLVMAANKAGISIAEILSEGLTDNKTNQLLEAMVEYLSDIYAETKNSKVVAQQFANVYGLTASDLKAAANLARSTNIISNQNLNYGGMITQLNNMANSMYFRTSTGEMMENMFENFQYGLAAGMANDPVLYTIYNAATVLDDIAGGIALPDIKVMGSGVNLQTTVADLMRVGAIGTSALGGVIKLVAGLAKGSGGGFSGSGMLKAFGVDSSLQAVTRGSGDGLLTTTLMDTSNTGSLVVNENSSDIQEKTITDAQQDGNKQLAEKQEEDNETKLSTVDEHIVSIYNLLDSVINGSAAIRTKSELDLSNNP